MILQAGEKLVEGVEIQLLFLGFSVSCVQVDVVGFLLGVLNVFLAALAAVRADGHELQLIGERLYFTARGCECVADVRKPKVDEFHLRVNLRDARLGCFVRGVTRLQQPAVARRILNGLERRCLLGNSPFQIAAVRVGEAQLIAPPGTQSEELVIERPGERQHEEKRTDQNRGAIGFSQDGVVRLDFRHSEPPTRISRQQQLLKPFRPPGRGLVPSQLIQPNTRCPNLPAASSLRRKKFASKCWIGTRR